MKKLKVLLVFCLLLVCFLTGCNENNTYQVVFKDNEGNEIKTILVRKGEIPTPPTVEKDGYEFIGWDKELDKITEDLEVTADFQIKKFKVIFKDYNDYIIDQQEVPYLSPAIKSVSSSLTATETITSSSATTKPGSSVT